MKLSELTAKCEVCNRIWDNHYTFLLKNRFNNREEILASQMNLFEIHKRNEYKNHKELIHDGKTE